MIKRRFYKLEHGDRDAPSDSSSSSDSELELVASEEEEGDDGMVAEVRPRDESSSSSGYESENSSANDVDLDKKALPGNDDGIGSEDDRISSGNGNLERVEMQPEPDGISSNAADYVLIIKSVYKCRICPKVVCLNEETLRAHLQSKRHARSEKLLHEGRLKLMLNNKGDIEGDSEEETHAPTVSTEQIEHFKDKRQRRPGRKFKNKKRSASNNGREPRKDWGKRRR